MNMLHAKAYAVSPLPKQATLLRAVIVSLKVVHSNQTQIEQKLMNLYRTLLKYLR